MTPDKELKTETNEKKSAWQRLKEWITSRRTIGFVCCVAIIAALSVAYFYPDASQGNVLRQHDTQQGIAIGQEAKAYAEATGEQSWWTNSLFGGMPTFQISPTYESNALFGWINTVMGLGLPSPANLLAMMMLGFFILLIVMKVRTGLALIGAIAYGFSTYFIILIGAGHIWKFVTLAYIPPTIAGIVLAYRGRYLAGGALAAVAAMMQIASNHVQMTYYFLAVVIGFVVAYFVIEMKRGRLRSWATATGALAVAAVLAVGANAPSLYNTQAYSRETMRGAHSELTQTTAEGSENATDGLDRDYITQYSYQPSETFTLLIPNVKGGATMKPEKGGFKALTLADMPDAGKQGLEQEQMAYLEYLSQYFGDPEGTNGPVYVGAIVFALFLLGCVVVKGPIKWTLVVLTVLSILLAWGRHLMMVTDLAIDLLPMYSKFRTVESILVVAEFTMPLLGILGLERVLTSKDGWKEYRKPVLWTLGITMGICLIGAVMPSVFGDVLSERDRDTDALIAEQLTRMGATPDVIAQAFSLTSPTIYNAVESLRLGLVSSDAWRSLIFVALAGALLVLYMKGKLNQTMAVAGVGLLVVIDLFSVNKRYLDHESFVPKRLTVGAPIAKTPADEQILKDTTMNYRVMDMPRFYSADPSYYHKAVGGYHAAKLTRYQDIIDRHLENFMSGKEGDGDWNVVNMLNTRYIVDMEGQPLRNPEAMGNAWLVDKVAYVDGPDAEMAGLDKIEPSKVAVADKRWAGVLGQSREKSAGDTIYETSYAPNRLTYNVRSAKGGVAVFSEVFFPWGWEATIDGKPAEIGRVNYILRAMNVPAGEHRIEMRFDPPSIKATVKVAKVSVVLIYLSVAAAIALWLTGRGGTRREERRREDEGEKHEA